VVSHLRNRIEVEVAAVREDIVELAAAHNELHKILIIEVDLEGEEGYQLRDVVFDVIADHRTLYWIEALAL